jgi:hypothetical protein
MFPGNRAVRTAFLKVGIVLSVATLFTVSLHAQTTPEAGSSSADYRFLLTSDELGGLSPAPAAAASQYGGGQYGGGNPAYQSRWSHLAIEGGGGFTAPLGNSSNDLTWGWNARGGLGWNFSKQFAVLGEWEFNRDKIPGRILSEVGEPGGNVHTWSLTLDPVWNYKTSGPFGGYVTGGGGFSRQLTSFTEPVLAQGVYCTYFYCYPVYYTTNVVVSHYSSNQGALNIGTGLTFGHWENAKLFTEARYEWLDTPGHSTQILPVTLGLRW